MPQKLKALLAATFVFFQQLPSFERAAYAHSHAKRETSTTLLAQFPALPLLMMVPPGKQETWKDLAQRLFDSPWDVSNNIDLACKILPELPSANIHRIACTHRLALTLAYDSKHPQTKAAESLLSNCIESFEGSSPKDRRYLANCYYDIGILLLQQGSLQKAIENLNKAQTIFQNSEQTDSTALADTFYSLGICYAKLGKDSELLAIDAFSNAAKAYEQLVNQIATATTVPARRMSQILLAESALSNASGLACQISDWNKAEELSRQGIAVSNLRRNVSDRYLPGFFYTLAQALKSKGDLVGAANTAKNGLSFFGLNPDKPALRKDPFLPLEGDDSSKPVAEYNAGKESPCALCLIKSLSLGTEKLSYDMTRTAIACAEPIPPANFAVFPQRLDIPLPDSSTRAPDTHVLDSNCLVPTAGSSKDRFPSESSDRTQLILQNNLLAQRDEFTSGANTATTPIEPQRKSNDSEGSKQSSSESALLDKLFNRTDLQAQTIPLLDRSSPSNLISILLDSTNTNEKSQELSRLAALANLFAIVGGASDQLRSQHSASNELSDSLEVSSSDSNYLLGQIATIMDDREAAVKLFESALASAPNNDRRKKSLAAAYHKLSQSTKNSSERNLELSQISNFWDPENSIFVSALNAHVQKNGKDPSAFEDRIKLSNAAADKGSLRAAIAECETALKLKKDHGCRLKLGDLYQQIGDYDKAIQEFQLAALDADKYGSLIKLGLIYKERGDLAQAIKFFQQAAEVHPHDQVSLNLLNESWQTAARLAPSAWENHAGLGQSFKSLGDFGQAAAEFRIALIFSPNNTEVQDLLDKLPSTANEQDSPSKPAVRTMERSANQATTLSPVLREPSIPQDNDVDFGPYMADLQHRIKRVWFPPRVATSSQVVVTFELSKLGELSKLRINQSSGSSEADRAGVRAVEAAAPFRVLPAGSPKTVDIQFTFDRNVQTETEPTDSFSAGTPTYFFHTYLAPETKQDSALDVLLNLPAAHDVDKAEVKLSVPPIPASLNLSTE